MKTKDGQKTRLNRIREINEIDPKKQQVFKSINYQIPKKLKNQGRDSGLINISEKQNEVLSEGEVVSNDSSFRYGSQKHEKTYDQPRSISDFDKYKTKDFFKKMDQQIDTNDLYQNATKLK